VKSAARWIEAWNQWWFPQSTGLRLAVCRIVVVAAQLFVFMPFFQPSLAEHLVLLRGPTGFVEPQWMIALLAAIPGAGFVFTPIFMTIAYFATIGAGASTLVGFRTRVSAALFALGTWFFVSHAYSYGEEHHAEAILAIFLLLLALSPSGRRLSLDAVRRRRDAGAPGTVGTAVWPLKLVQLLLAWSYLSNGVAKLAFGGLEWMNGYTLQTYMLQDALKWDLPLGVWLAQHHALCVWLSVATIVFEMTFVLAVFVRRVRPAYLAGGAMLHLGIYLTMGAIFFQHIVLYACFFDVERGAAQPSGRYSPSSAGHSP